MDGKAREQIGEISQAPGSQEQSALKPVLPGAGPRMPSWPHTAGELLVSGMSFSCMISSSCCIAGPVSSKGRRV